MQIAVLCATRSYSARRVRDACRERGHQATLLVPSELTISVGSEGPRLFQVERELQRYDAVIPRIGASSPPHGLAVVRQFEHMGTFCLNSAAGINRARDKLRLAQLLARHGLPIPATVAIQAGEQVRAAIRGIGGAPLVIKLLEGSQGLGVMLADTDVVAEAIVEALHVAGRDVLIQRFVSEARGRDVRAFVVGGRVIAAMRRVAAGDEFRSNVHRGGHAEPVDLSPDFTSVAIGAAQLVGLRVAGVDMLESDQGPQIMEINSSPGLEGIESATGIDVAGAIAAHLEERVAFPDVDLRPKLGIDTDHAIVEMALASGSPYLGLALGACPFASRNTRVLSLLRGGRSIPAPGEDEILEAGDVLVCFGRIDALAQLRVQSRPTPAREAVPEGG